MKKYSIQINGMHCSGCKNLISITLEDLGYSNVSVSLENNFATFQSDKDLKELKLQLDKAFAEDLKEYSYSNLISTN